MIIRPRLNDFHNLPFTQEEVDFAIPFLDEDIPLYLDPFLLWKSPSQQDQALHIVIKDSFNYLGVLYLKNEAEAIYLLKELSECNEVGMGNSKKKEGKKIGDRLAREILSTFKDIPQVNEVGFEHFETIQLLVEDFSKDRISDIACNLIKSFLVDYTAQQSEKYKIPTEEVKIRIFDTKKNIIKIEKVNLPTKPYSTEPILFVPKRWLRFIPWINFEDYYQYYISVSTKLLKGESIGRVEILEYNRKNYDQVKTYIERRQLKQTDCKNDPLFTQIPILSSKRRLATISKLPTGKTDGADKAFENELCPLISSMLYPELDFASTQCRTDSGVLIRDLIFYNNMSHSLLKDIYKEFNSKQLVFELKNVKELESTHINQLNRYLNKEFGNFGVIFTRNKPPKSVYKNTVDLWSGQRKCILILDDEDLKLMCNIYENKQRKPIDVLNRKYREFIKSCPS